MFEQWFSVVYALTKTTCNITVEMCAFFEIVDVGFKDTLYKCVSNCFHQPSPCAFVCLSSRSVPPRRDAWEWALAVP